MEEAFQQTTMLFDGTYVKRDKIVFFLLYLNTLANFYSLSLMCSEAC